MATRTPPRMTRPPISEAGVMAGNGVSLCAHRFGDRTFEVSGRYKGSRRYIRIATPPRTTNPLRTPTSMSRWNALLALTLSPRLSCANGSRFTG